MNARRAAWLGALALLALALAGRGEAFEGRSRLALAGLAACVALGLPREPRARVAARLAVTRLAVTRLAVTRLDVTRLDVSGAAGSERERPAAGAGAALVRGLAYAAPPLGLAFALERAAGASAAELTRLVAAVLALLVLCACACELGARTPRGARVHAALWSALALGAPLAAALVRWIARVEPPRALAQLARFSPLDWLARRIAEPAPGELASALAGAAALCAASLWAGRAPPGADGVRAERDGERARPSALGERSRDDALGESSRPSAAGESSRPSAAGESSRPSALGALTLALLVCAPFGFAAHRAPPLRLARLELELAGPLDAVELELAPFARAELALALVAGETRRLTLPLPAPALGAPPTPRVHAHGGGSARVVGWSEPAAPLAPALAARPLPPVEAGGAADAHPRAAAWVGLALALAAVASARRRVAAGLALGLAGGLALAAYGAAPQAAGRRVVLDGDGASGRWIETLAAPQALALAGEGAELEGAALLVRPEERALELRGPGAELARPRWRLGAGRGASLWLRRARAMDERRFVRPRAEAAPGELRNAWGPLTAVWWRSAAGEWRTGGAWEQGAPLSESFAAGGEEPAPGWLAAGLPPGVEVLLARVAPGAWAPAAGEAASEVWLRTVRPATGP